MKDKNTKIVIDVDEFKDAEKEAYDYLLRHYKEIKQKYSRLYTIASIMMYIVGMAVLGITKNIDFLIYKVGFLAAFTLELGSVCVLAFLMEKWKTFFAILQGNDIAQVTNILYLSAYTKIKENADPQKDEDETNIR